MIREEIQKYNLKDVTAISGKSNLTLRLHVLNCNSSEKWSAKTMADMWNPKMSSPRVQGQKRQSEYLKV